MTHLLRFDDLQASFHQCSDHLPDHRKPSPNTRYTIQDAVLGALGIFFTQSPSFVEYQRRLQHTQGHNNAQTLLGVAQMPWDHQVRPLRDPFVPSPRAPVFVEIFKGLEQHHMLDHLRMLGAQLLVSLAGTTSFSSKTLPCPTCLTRQLSTGPTLYYHAAIPPVIVCPGRPAGIALPPEYSMPQDGQAQQDCEQGAGQRWISTHAQVGAPHQVPLLGAALYSKQPFCALALQQGFHFILTCKPDSPATLYERWAFWQAKDGRAALERRRWHGRFTEVMRYRYINDVRLRGGDEAWSVHGGEITVVSAKTGEQL